MHYLVPLAASSPDMAIIMVLMVVALVVLLAIASVMWKFGSLWIQAQLSGAPIAIWDLIGMSLRRVSPALITRARVMSRKAGLDVSTERLTAHAQAGGDVIAVVEALIAASQNKNSLSFEEACTRDLGHRSTSGAANTSVQPNGRTS